METFNGAIGIDLGTTYSCIGIWVDDRVEIIANDLGSRTTPSWVAFNGHERLIGEVAKQQATSNPLNTFYDVKRLIGRLYHDQKLQEELPQYNFKITPDHNDSPMINAEIDGQIKKFKAEEISAMVLQKMKSIAEDYLGKKVINAVITVPAYFNDSQRVATENAAKIAGLKCLRLINEPTAACLCYGLQNKTNANVLVFDLGGGTFDVSVVEINGGIIEVKATNGDTHLGGEDFDHRLVKHLVTQFETKHKCIIQSDSPQGIKALRKLKDCSETIKKRLSQMQSVQVEIDSLYGGIDFKSVITRTTFETLCLDLFQSCLEPVKKVLVDADLKATDIDEIVLVGGSTRIPCVQDLLSKFFGGKTLNRSVNPDEAVAYGAAVQGAILTKSDSSGKTKDMVLVDVIPLSLGIETTGGIMTTIIPRNSSVPTEKSSLFSTMEDNQTVVLVQVFQGERKFTKDNHLLGTFELTGIPKAIRGVPKIEVTFNMNESGILKVTAFEKNSQVHQEVTISKDSGQLTPEEIQNMIAEADQFRASDEIKKENIEMRNAFEKYLQQSQTTINDSEFPDALTTDERSQANQLILSTQDWLGAIDTDTNEPCERTKAEIIDCKQSVEYYLKPFVNKVYARQIAISAERNPEQVVNSTSEINQALGELNLESTTKSSGSPPTTITSKPKLKKIILKKK